MEILALTFGLMVLVMGGMAVGVVFSNRELRGSCGGVGGRCACEEAGTPGACEGEEGEEGEGPQAGEAQADGTILYGG